MVVLNERRQIVGIVSDADVLAQMQEQDRPRLLATLTNWSRGKTGHLQTPTATPGLRQM